MLVPTVRFPHCNHGLKDVVPGLLFHHHFIREHAAVPADVGEGASFLAVRVTEPGAGVADDVEATIRIDNLTVAAGLVVGTGPVHGAVVLSYVEIDRPGPKSIG